MCIHCKYCAAWKYETGEHRSEKKTKISASSNKDNNKSFDETKANNVLYINKKVK
jgi:hypothetical protein